MAYDAATVANRLIELASENDKQLTPMQLIKLSYIAHGFSLAIFKRPLLNESIEAWKYGPVVPSLYKRLKHYGANKVTASVGAISGETEALQLDDKQLVDLVYEKYGALSGVQLSHLTHRPGTPWAVNYVPNSYGMDINNALIQTHYAALLAV